MAITFLHTSYGQDFADDSSVAFTADVPVGSLIVVFVTGGAATTSFTIVDDWGHTYNLVDSPEDVTLGSGQIAWALTTRPLYTGDRIVVHAPSSGDTNIRYTAYSGCDGTLIDTSHAVDKTFPTSAANSGNVTIPATETLLVAGIVYDGAGAFSAPSSGFTSRGDTLGFTSSWRFYMEDRIVTGGAGNYASAPTGVDRYWSSTLLAFAAGTPPVSTEIVLSFPIADEDSDASAYRRDDTVAWPPAGSINDTGDNLFVAKGNGTTYTYSNNVFFRWDTSMLPADAIIVAARVRPHVIDRGGSAAYLLEADYYDFGGGTPTLSDYAFTVTSVLVPYPYSAIIPGSVYAFPIANFSGINTSGYTGLRFAFNEIGAPGTAANYSIQFAAYNSAGAVARLEIAYTLDAEVASFPVDEDGSGFYQGTSWPPSGGSFTARDSTIVRVQKSESGGDYYAEIGLLRFNTSALPDGATVVGAALKIYVEAIANPEAYDVIADYYDFGGEPTVPGDWIQTSSPSIIESTDLGSFITDGVNTILFTDVTGINKTGYTGIRLTLSAGTPTEFNQLDFTAEEGTNPAAELVVYYTEEVATAYRLVPPFIR